jgi:hypothetical protein
VVTPLFGLNPRNPGLPAPVGAGEACELSLFAGIVTKSAKGVYQNHGYMNPPPTPKISPANKATLINQVAAPTKAVNQNTKY